MLLTLNLVVFLNLLVFFAIFFFGKKNSLPNKVLGLILIDPGINFLSNIIVFTGHFSAFPYLFFLAQYTAYLFAPLVYIYCLLLIGQKINRRHPMFILTGLALLMCTFFAIEYMGMSPHHQEAYLNGLQNEPYPWQQDLVNSFFILFQQIYFSLAALSIYQYRKRAAHRISSFEKTKLAYITRFILLIWLLNLITIGLYLVLPMTVVEYIGLPTVVTLIYFFILYYAFHYHSIFTPQTYHQFLQDNAPTSAERVEHCLLQEADQPAPNSELGEKVLIFLDTHRPYLIPDLTLEGLAEMMHLNCGSLSHAINRHLQKTFYDLINEKRIAQSKTLLLQKHQELTIEAIGYESGFNSRASFYRAFRKYGQQTPREFLEKNGLTAFSATKEN